MAEDDTGSNSNGSSPNQESRRVSRGQLKLEDIIRKLLPLETLELEHGIGERLRLDLYYPRHKLAFEYHGRQHFEYVSHFHKDAYGFQDSLKRDERKEELCVSLGIVLLIFRYDDTLDEESVFDRMQEAIKNSNLIAPSPSSKKKWPKPDKQSPFHKERLAAQKKYRQENYQRMKDLKKGIDGR